MAQPKDSFQTDVVPLPSPTEYLSPEQRSDAIAEILATIALRALKQSHETNATINQ